MPLSTATRLLSRCRWRKVQSGTKQVKSVPAAQDNFNLILPGFCLALHWDFSDNFSADTQSYNEDLSQIFRKGRELPAPEELCSIREFLEPLEGQDLQRMAMLCLQYLNFVKRNKS